MFERIKDVGHPNEELLSVYRDHGVVKRDDRNDNFNKAALDRNIYQLIHPGWLVVNRMKAWQGSVGISPFRGIVSGHYICFRPHHNEDSRFLNWILRSDIYTAEYSALSRGVRPNQVEIDNDLLRVLPIKLPPLDEQRRIADFLDAETARIDAISHRRGKQLELLSDREVSLAYSAIRGEEFEEERSPTSLRWLGDAPKNWPILNVSSQFDIKLGKMLNEDRTSGERMRHYLRNTNVQWDHIDTEDLLLMNFPEAEKKRYEVLPGDLLICEGGDPGRAAIWDGRVPEIYYQKALHRARSRGRSDVRWLYYCLRAATALNVFAVEGNTTTIAHLTGEQLARHRFPFPDPSIQRQLVRKLDARIAACRNTAAQINRQLSLLAERRQALITAAVTGQLDVTTAGRAAVG